MGFGTMKNPVMFLLFGEESLVANFFSIITTLVSLSFLVWTFMPKWLKRIIHSIIHLLRLKFRVLNHIKKYHGCKYSIADTFEDLVLKYPNRVQFISVDDNERVTLEQLDVLANKVAHWSSYNMHIRIHIIMQYT